MPARKRATATAGATAPKPRAPRKTKKPRAPRTNPALYKPLPGETWGQRAERLRDAFETDLRALGLAPWEPEYQFARLSHRRKWAMDIAWPDARVVVEIEGRGAHQRGRYHTDMEKYNRAALMGWLLLRVTYDMIADGRAIALVQEAFALRHAAA